MEKKIPLVVIGGPTASGKTALSIEIAKRFNGEIVSADSMQIYKYMDIGTAKPTKEEMSGIKHHMIDIVEPDEAFTVADYVQRAKECIEKIYNAGKLPIVVGGTGLYIDSLIQNRQFTEMDADYELRERLTLMAEKHSGEYLKRILSAFDPESAKKIDSNNIKRLVRAIEVYMVSGKTITWQNEHSKGEEIYNVCYMMPDMDRATLYDRINRRVDVMIDMGLVDEVKGLLEKGYSKTLNSMQAIGYKETAEFVENNIEFEQFLEKIKQNSRRYAKRQLTWFKNNDKILTIAGIDTACLVIREFIEKYGYSM